MKRTHLLFFILGGFFITNALVAELIAGKIFTLEMPVFIQTVLSWISVYEKNFVVSVGVISWPIVFVATDIVNEFFGRRGVRFYTFVTVGLIAYAFFVLMLARWVPAASFSPVPQEMFSTVFGASQWIIVGSITAFLMSQWMDVLVFRKVRQKTGRRHLWARATGSTVVSQCVDTFVVGFIAFYLPGSFTFDQFLQVATTSYVYKIGVAIAATPLCYLGEYWVKKFLGSEEAERLVESSAHATSESIYSL